MTWSMLINKSLPSQVGRKKGIPLLKKKKIQPNIHANKRYARAGDVPVGESLCGHVDDFLLSSDAAITSS
jgi:hypothetical protein